MAWSDWLLIVVALLLVGVATAWVLRRRRDAAPAPTTVDGEPATATTAVVHEPAPAATIDNGRPEATVDPAPSAVADPVTSGDGRADDTPAAVATVDPVDHADMALTGDPVPAPEHATPAETDHASAAATGAPTGTTEPTAAQAEPAAAQAEAAVAQAEAAVVEPEPEPVAVPAARGPVANPPVRTKADAAATDDFRRIQGVGPKMEAALHAAGIRTYRQLADLDESALRETVRAAGLRATASLSTWPQQAKVLADASEAATA